MKLEVGMYVRTKRDGIGKIISLSVGEEDECCFIELSNRRTGTKEHNIIKASYNIIDLIEVGDYVNGKLVTKTNSIFPINNSIYIECYCEMNGTSLCWCYSNEEIKTIVTKECFESMQYEVK